MVDIRIVWGYNDKNDTSQGWYIRISDPITGELWSEIIMDIPGQENIINIRGTDMDVIHYMIININQIKNTCQLQKYAYEDGVQAINELSPSDFG